MEIEQGISVTVQDRFGDVTNQITLRDLVRTGDNYTINLVNGGKVGSSNYELVIDCESQLIDKIQMANDLVTA